MRNIIRWIEEYALAETGAIAGDELDRRVTALRELSRNHDVMTPTQFRETLTTAHFTDYFADAISRAFYADYEYKVGQWQNYVYMDEAPDFRGVKRFRMTEPGTLQKRYEKEGPMSTTYITPSYIEYGVDEWAVEIDFSWRTIVNDDLGKIRETPRRMVNAHKRWIDAFVSALYDNAVTQATLAALGAPWAGTGRLTAPNLAIGLNAMMQRVDANGNQMNISRVHLVIPPILKIQAADILQDLLQYGGAGGNVLGQFLSGSVYVDPYIATAGLNVPWYLFADPSEIPAVTLVRMRGWPGPVVSMKKSDIQVVTGTAPAAFLMGSYNTGDIHYAVEDVIGAWDDAAYVGVTDFRGIYYSSGTTG
jgi:hypothetical protein